MNRILDVVNLNADASCLDSKAWIDCLKSPDKPMLRWLESFVKSKSAVLFGVCGSTLADIKHFLPSAIDLVRNHPEIFRFTVRPFSHAASYFLTPHIRELNLELGIATHKLLGLTLEPVYLPPEFMVTHHDIILMEKNNVDYIFINPNRFERRFNENALTVKFSQQSNQLMGLLTDPNETKSYLSNIQTGDSPIRNQNVPRTKICWRDGESWLLIPDGLQRECFFIESRSKKEHVINWSDFTNEINSSKNQDIKFYPRHPLTKWTGSDKLIDLHRDISSLSNSDELANDYEALNKFLYVISSDVFSSVEKADVEIQLRCLKSRKHFAHLIERKARHLEAEQILLNLMGIPTRIDMPGVYEKLTARQSILGQLCEKQV